MYRVGDEQYVVVTAGSSEAAGRPDHVGVQNMNGPNFNARAFNVTYTYPSMN